MDLKHVEAGADAVLIGILDPLGETVDPNRTPGARCFRFGTDLPQFREEEGEADLAT